MKRFLILREEFSARFFWRGILGTISSARSPLHEFPCPTGRRGLLIFLLLTFNLCSLTSFSQDTTFRYYPQFTKYRLISRADSLHALDTTFNFIYHYHPAERPFGYLHLGYLGAPETSMYFVPPHDAGIDIGFHQFDLYWRTIDDVKFFDTREPYVMLGYQQGSRSEIVASVVHTQNIGPHLNLGIDFHRMRTDGWYQRQTAKISNFNAYLHYHSPKNRYHGIVAFVLNSLKVQQNGGLQSANIFTDSTIFDKTLAFVSLDSAQTTWKNNEIIILNALNFGKWIVTEKKDSSVKKRIEPALRVQERFEWEKRNYFFYDSRKDAAFYLADTFAFKLRPIRDSLIYHRVMNEVRITKLQRDTSMRAFKFSADVFLRHSFYKIQNNNLDYRVQSGILGADFSTLFFSKLKLNSFGELNLIDRNAGDFILDASTEYFITKGRGIGVEAMISRNHPSIIQQRYQSAYFNWSNDFVPMTTVEGNVYYFDEKWKLRIGASWFSQSNYIYWTGRGIPNQFATPLTGFNATLAKDFKAWHIHLDNELMYQTFNSDSIVSFPGFILRSSLYYQSDLFNYALQTKTGIEVRYNQDYYAPAFQPATGQFLIQRNSEQHYYPIVDFFVVVKVKAVRAFLQVQNLAQGFLGNGNYSAYHYPMPDRAFKVGFEWMFWN